MALVLSSHFTLAEFTKSQTATRFGIDNTPPPEAIKALTALCSNVLEPVRRAFGRLDVSSGYRCPQLNAHAGGAKDSQHMKGEAADIEAFSVSNVDLARWIVAQKLPFDQLILEFFVPGDPHSGWVHVSHAAHNRGEVLVASKVSGKLVYTHGLPA